MRILITGGSGFIGSTLALDYAARGHQVVVVAKEATDAERQNAEDLRRSGVEFHQGSVTEPELMERAMKGVDAVHHIAAAMREANIPDRAFWEINVAATRALLELARRRGVGRFVYCSSIGAMGKTPAKPASEESPCVPVDIYQKTKRAAEELCLDYHRNHGLPLAIVRPAEVYGPRDRRLLKLFKAIARRRFVMIGNGRNEHHLVHIDDLVQGFRLAQERDQALGQIFIIAGERSTQLNAMVAAIAAELGVPPPKLRVPLAPVRLAAALVEDLCKPLRIQPPLYRRRIDFFRSDYSFDIGKARRLLGFKPQRTLEAGIRSTLEWYRQSGLLRPAGRPGAVHENGG